ncbi:MAG: WYL domain-containing protein [Candidatus Gastranaerophilales bacterium]|nr:WYL domain-containing protein [Candidatus Gastranaerophilales bacterium]
MKKPKKVTATSVRVLETLKILYEKSSSVQDIIHYFENSDYENKVYTSEAILKYINTLKVFGMRFAKEKDKYKLLTSPCQFHFDEKDLNAIRLIEKFSNLLPEKGTQCEINGFLQDLEKRFSDKTRLIAHNVTKPDFREIKTGYNKYLKQISECEQYCADGLKLKITYKNYQGKELSIIAEPNDIKYLGQEIYLSVYNPVSAQIQDINFSSILKIEQLPQKATHIGMLSSVTFELKDRLAKAYKLHEGEKLLQKKSDGNIIISNQKEDRTLLLKRLMRYGEYCEVISPKSFREEIKEMIKRTLDNYLLVNK